jgi:hypothetical protein
MIKNHHLAWIFLSAAVSFAEGLSQSKSSPTISTEKTNSIDRRQVISGSIGVSTLLFLSPHSARAVGGGGLASKLAKLDPAALSNSVFNVPPGAQVYPEFLRGGWDISCKFGGFLFPSQKIPRERVTANSQTPGFQKCSIAAICDVGKDTSYRMRIDETSGLEDRQFTLKSQIDNYLGYNAVSEVLYNAKANPNRISIDFYEYKTKNAERIELFCNARESEMVAETGVFVCSEYIRQVTFGTGSEVGIPRQAVGNYAHFWTFRKNSSEPNELSGNLLTAGYLDPQDPLFFDEPSKPVVVYSHVLTGTRIS